MPLEDQDEFDYEVILRVLKKHGVDFIVIGGVCAWLHGSSYVTFDLDIVHERSIENRQRLEAALRELHAYYWEHLQKRLEPEAERMGTPGHHLLKTDAGRLDVIGAVVGGQGYQELLARSSDVELDHDLTIRMLNLPDLIEIKEQTGRVKDKLVALDLRNVLQERLEEGADNMCTNEDNK